MTSMEEQIKSASAGFDYLFSDDISKAKETFTAETSPFHLLGAGVAAFMEAAMSGETALMASATASLASAEAGAKQQIKVAKQQKLDPSRRFPLGLEAEIVQADATVLLGLTHALGESYMGYLQCIYALNSAHSKLTKLFKSVFPSGLDGYSTPSQTTPIPSRTASTVSLSAPSVATTKSSFLGRWGSSSSLAVPKPSPELFQQTNGPGEELIVAGICLGFGLFNLVFSLLPKKIQGVVGFFGFQHDRKLALQALAVSAARKDVHSVFAGLVLMTYHGVVLLLSGFQGNREGILKQYTSVVDSIEPRFPSGSLWILNRAKILRMSGESEQAILVLQNGLRPDRPNSFPQADTMLVFELAWILLQQRRYQEAADVFIKITAINAWSHATYYFLAAGCYISLHNVAKAQELFDQIPALLEKNKLGKGGKDLPTEAFIRKKIAFYQEKQKRRGGKVELYAEAMKISPQSELAVFWNTHDHITKDMALEHIKEWENISPSVHAQSSEAITSPVDLDTPDEMAIRALLLGVVYRSAGNYVASRKSLMDAYSRKPTISTWVNGLAMFELAVLDCRECAAGGKQGTKEQWIAALESATEKLDKALSHATASTDLSSRLDSRISMLRDEIGIKRDILEIS